MGVVSFLQVVQDDVQVRLQGRQAHALHSPSQDKECPG